MVDLSYQLYSSRMFPPLADTLQMLANLGYKQVEGYGGAYGDLPGLAKALEDTDLAMSTGHFGLDMLENDPSKVSEIIDAAGMKAIYCPYLVAEGRPNDAAGWHAFGARVEAAGARFQAAGLIFGWHNHDFEFVALPDGSLPIDHIFAGGPGLSWEADLAWVERAGRKASEAIARHGSRISSVHIKDIAAAGTCLDEDGWADVGQGVMDWASLMAALKPTPARYFIMEHDKPNDHARFARRSFDTISSL